MFSQGETNEGQVELIMMRQIFVLILLSNLIKTEMLGLMQKLIYKVRDYPSSSWYEGELRLRISETSLPE